MANLSRSSTSELLDNTEQSQSNKAKCSILILQALYAFMTIPTEQHPIHSNEFKQSKCWGAYTRWKWCFKNNHKNKDQILFVQWFRKDDNFYWFSKLIGHSDFFIVVLFSFPPLLSEGQSGLQGKRFFTRNWAGQWKHRVNLHTCFFHRIREWLGLEGTSGNHLVQPLLWLPWESS